MTQFVLLRMQEQKKNRKPRKPPPHPAQSGDEDDAQADPGKTDQVPDQTSEILGTGPAEDRENREGAASPWRRLLGQVRPETTQEPPRQPRRLWRCLLWREGAVRVWGPSLVLVVLVNSYSRGTNWQYEWLLAMDTLAFSTIFLVPLCAGIAAYEAGRLSGQARDLLSVSPRGRRAVLATGLSVWLVVLVAAAVGLVVVSATVLWRTRGYPPLASDFLPLPLLVAYTAVGCAAGTLLGWRWPSRLTPGLAALGVFALIMTMHITGSGVELVSVGGATGSLVGMRLLTEMVVWQVVFYAGATLLLATVTTMVMGGGGRLHRAGRLASVVVSLALVGAGASGASQFGISRFGEVPVTDLTCQESHGLEVCSYPTYAALIPRTLEGLASYTEALREAGIQVPTRAVQFGGNDEGGQALVLGTETLRAANSNDPDSHQLLRSSVSGWYMPGHDCPDTTRTTEEFNAIWLVINWLELRVDGKPTRYVDEPERSLPDMTREEQDQSLREAVEVLGQHEPQC